MKYYYNKSQISCADLFILSILGSADSWESRFMVREGDYVSSPLLIKIALHSVNSLFRGKFFFFYRYSVVIYDYQIQLSI